MYLYIRGNLHDPVAKAIPVRCQVLLAARGAPVGRPALYLRSLAEAKLFGRAALLTVRHGVERSKPVPRARARPASRLRPRDGL